MSHNRLCAQSSRRRCRCSCAGLLHGHLPAPTTATPSRYTQLTLVAAGEPGRRRRVAARTDAGASSYLQGWVRTHRRLATTITEVVTEGVWRAIADRPEIDRRQLASSDHALCALLATMALQLDEGADPSGEDRSSVGITTGPVVHRVFQLIGAGQLDEVATLVRIAALATCPDVRWHPEVRQLTSDDAATRGLGRLSGQAAAIDPVPA